ncbi:MAG: type II toxin-antitoxin system VapC family toxin [Alphaproteobacteria bacterium]|nr:type II toxin-antitoxin system VapC family toxin [Alphaproteobacteria bacterium]MBV9964197.1 type II toxin-antitoxin system VapC family toxin [Alphaproteobacteria bacterium]
MTIVIDASVAVKWVLPEPRTEAALALRNEQLIAPALWLAEAANALWRHVRLGELTGEQALALMAELEKAPVASFPIEPHITPALEIAARAGHPVYDCVYLALALHRDTHVMTDDRRFAAAAARLGVGDRVRLLGSQL